MMKNRFVAAALIFLYATVSLAAVQATRAATTTGVIYIRAVYGNFPISIGGIGTTSTDGITLDNPTAATVGTTTQYSPRLKLCGAAWKSNATAASERDCWIIENRPVTGAAVTTSSLWFAHSINGGAYVDDGQMRNDGTLLWPNGVFSTTGNFTAQAAGGFTVNGRSSLISSADGKASLVNNANNIGLTFQYSAIPTVGTCGTSPSVTAGSLDTVGEVNVGTGGVATSCAINFASTWATAPKCVAGINSATLTDARAIAVTTTTGAATFVAAAYAASSKIWWICVSPK
jgi:hypothetical protein